jgi:hypothetical protein
MMHFMIAHAALILAVAAYGLALAFFLRLFRYAGDEE